MRQPTLRADTQLPQTERISNKCKCDTHCFAMHPILYTFCRQRGMYQSLDSHEYSSICSLDGGNHYSACNLAHKILSWAQQHSLTVISGNHAVLDPDTHSLYVFDMLLKKHTESTEHTSNCIAFISSCAGGRKSMSRARKHAIMVQEICQHVYNFHTEVLLFRVSSTGSLRVYFV